MVMYGESHPWSSSFDELSSSPASPSLIILSTTSPHSAKRLDSSDVHLLSQGLDGVGSFRLRPRLRSLSTCG